MAASTCTQVWHTLGMIKKVVITCVMDSTDGSFVATALSKPIDGYLLKLQTDPDGVTAPQDDYDITIVDDEGLDVLETKGTNRDTATTEMVALATGTYFHPVVCPSDTLTLDVTGNNVNSAGVVITLYYSATAG